MRGTTTKGQTMNRNEQTIDRIETMAERLRTAGVAVTIEQRGGTTVLEWTRDRNGYLAEIGFVSISKSTRTDNYRFYGGTVSRHGSHRKIKTWQDAYLAVSMAADLATDTAQAVTA